MMREYTISPSKFELFVAAHQSGRGQGHFSAEIGEIQLKFYRVKYVRCQLGTKVRSSTTDTSGTRGSNGRDGAMETVRGTRLTNRGGFHSTKGSHKPVASSECIGGGRCTISEEQRTSTEIAQYMATALPTPR